MPAWRVGAAALAALLYVTPWLYVFARLLGTPLGVDFGMLRTAGLAAFQLQNPYTTGPGFYNAPWMLLIIAPFALLPQGAGFVIWTSLGAASYTIAFRRLGLGWVATFILLFSPLAIGNLMFGNYDWLILLGATLPPAAGMWFLVLKPQLGIMLAALWAWRSARSGIRSFAAVVLPVALAWLASYLLGYRLPDSNHMAWSADVWPWGIPIGAILSYLALRRQDPLLALAAAPFLSPYVVWHSWIVVLLPLARHRWLLAVGIIASWLFFWWAFSHA